MLRSTCIAIISSIIIIIIIKYGFQRNVFSNLFIFIEIVQFVGDFERA